MLAVDTQVLKAHEVFVVDPTDTTKFISKPMELLGFNLIEIRMGGENFKRDEVVILCVPRLIDHTKGASPNDVLKFVGTESFGLR